jgi:prepilin-type processing-associated H-X9-DG protein
MKSTAADQGRRPFTFRAHAFSRVDLCAVVAVVTLLGGWLAVVYFGENGRSTRCAWNLSAMGKAMEHYADDHGDALPAAGINLGKTQVTWDSKLIPYLEPKLTQSSSEQLFARVPQHFLCPSDRVSHKGTPRSYAMSGHDMRPDHWPPGNNTATGVGLYWTKAKAIGLLGETNAALKNPELLPALRRSALPDPANTILVTEFIDPWNLLGNQGRPSVSGAAPQRRYLKENASAFHGGRFNYLLADGHVELLSALQTGSFDGTAGLWTLKQGD